MSLVMKEKKNKKMISQPYKYAVKKLPDKIIPEKCSHKVSFTTIFSTFCSFPI